LRTSGGDVLELPAVPRVSVGKQHSQEPLPRFCDAQTTQQDAATSCVSQDQRLL